MLRNLRFEDLHRAIERLNAREQKMISLQYNNKLTMEELDQIYGISKVADKVSRKVGGPCLLTANMKQGSISYVRHEVWQAALENVLTTNELRAFFLSYARPTTLTKFPP